MRDATLDALAYDVQGAVEGGSVRRPRYEHLPDVGLRGERVLAEHRRVDGHAAEVHQSESLALNLLYHYAEHARLKVRVLGKEHQTRAVLALLRHGNALQENELVGYLKHDAGTVAGLVVSTLGTPVLHVLEHLESRVHQFVRLVAVYVHYHTHSARIVFV